ncbi:MAG: hypothetical protein QNJ70_28255 [Xenococcaceae cyanobacterium MO_207.B15]|nr:hypothetical protein [Xenococcaceae cyanobacterium MO_207.B15]
MKSLKNSMLSKCKVISSLGSVLITGVILAISVPVLAQSYKGKCKDIIEGDLDSCRVLIENNNLYLKFKESKLNQTINLNRIINLQMTDWKGTSFWTGGTKLRKNFAISWNDGTNSYIPSFRLEPQDAIELMSFLEMKIGRSFKNEINNTEQTMNQIMADNRRRDQETLEGIIMREHQQKLAEIQSRQPEVNVNFFPGSNLWGLNNSRRYTCKNESRSSFSSGIVHLVNADTTQVFATNLTSSDCQEARNQLIQTGFACINKSSPFSPFENYHLIDASGETRYSNITKSDCQQKIGKF